MARVAKLQQEVDAAQAIRLGMTTEKCYKERMGAINSEIMSIASCQTKDERIAQNRHAFRRFFGVKEKKNG